MSQSRLRGQTVLTYLFLREQNHINRPLAANDEERFTVVRIRFQLIVQTVTTTKPEKIKNHKRRGFGICRRM